MRMKIAPAGLLLFGVLFASAASAVPYDRVTVRLGRIEPLLALPSAATPSSAADRETLAPRIRSADQLARFERDRVQPARLRRDPHLMPHRL